VLQCPAVQVTPARFHGILKHPHCGRRAVCFHERKGKCRWEKQSFGARELPARFPGYLQWHRYVVCPFLERMRVSSAQQTAVATLGFAFFSCHARCPFRLIIILCIAICLLRSCALPQPSSASPAAGLARDLCSASAQLLSRPYCWVPSTAAGTSSAPPPPSCSLN